MTKIELCEIEAGLQTEPYANYELVRKLICDLHFKINKINYDSSDKDLTLNICNDISVALDEIYELLEYRKTTKEGRVIREQENKDVGMTERQGIFSSLYLSAILKL